MASCCAGGDSLGWATPIDAFTNSERETLLYTIAVVPDHSRPDYLATIDADPESETYSQVIARTPVPYKGDELHHSGWNACSSCFGDKSGKRRKYLVTPALATNRVYAFDVATDPRQPTLAKVVEPEALKKTGLAYLHTSHCLANGEVMISGMGDADGNAKGGFILLDGDTFEVKDDKWAEQTTEFGYDFWYQPHHDLLVSSSWGAPSAFSKGFNPAEVAEKYGDKLFFFSWKERKLTQTISLGAEGLIPLEIRFLHNPWKANGFVGAALSSNVIHIHKEVNGSTKWKTDVVIKQPWTKVEGWALPEMPPLITDILISLDDRFIYFSNWLRGDLVQYDISDPANPKFNSRVWLGGSIRKGGSVKVLEGLPEDTPEQPEIPTVKGVELQGGPQMIQLSRDGRRLYVTNSLFSPWDQQFYRGLAEKGSQMLLVDVDLDNGGKMSLNTSFLVDFGAEPEGPALAHETRYPGGDCSSDIWVVETDPQYQEKLAAEEKLVSETVH
ncbi:hypothetical protein D9Q98_005935 [Chlorella vulgaris]|uniref:Methanethiol oxidase n=1 Tax=Chlorella vulgaris TaxID=3077 RepID=A0A9D4TWP1_CHLVU|nr:hypothetical protein D9Q98_005935 [Chlorella vulgaris]